MLQQPVETRVSQLVYILALARMIRAIAQQEISIPSASERSGMQKAHCLFKKVESLPSLFSKKRVNRRIRIPFSGLCLAENVSSNLFKEWSRVIF